MTTRANENGSFSSSVVRDARTREPPVNPTKKQSNATVDQRLNTGGPRLSGCGNRERMNGSWKTRGPISKEGGTLREGPRKATSDSIWPWLNRQSGHTWFSGFALVRWKSSWPGWMAASEAIPSHSAIKHDTAFRNIRINPAFWRAAFNLRGNVRCLPRMDKQLLRPPNGRAHPLTAPETVRGQGSAGFPIGSGPRANSPSGGKPALGLQWMRCERKTKNPIASLFQTRLKTPTLLTWASH